MFSWPQNGKTYLIRGRRYWRYDDAARRPDPGYPRDLSLWEGAPPAPDDVTVGNTGGRVRGERLGGPRDAERGPPGGFGEPSGVTRRSGRGGLDGPPKCLLPAPQVTPTSSRAPTTGAFSRAASRRSPTPLNPWVTSGWTARPPALAPTPPGPPKRPSSLEPAIVSARSIRPQGGHRCPSCCPFYPCWWGASPPAEEERPGGGSAGMLRDACGGSLALQTRTNGQPLGHAPPLQEAPFPRRAGVF